MRYGTKRAEWTFSHDVCSKAEQCVMWEVTINGTYLTRVLGTNGQNYAEESMFCSRAQAPRCARIKAKNCTIIDLLYELIRWRRLTRMAGNCDFREWQRDRWCSHGTGFASIEPCTLDVEKSAKENKFCFNGISLYFLAKKHTHKPAKHGIITTPGINAYN